MMLLPRQSTEIKSHHTSGNERDIALEEITNQKISSMPMNSLRQNLEKIVLPLNLLIQEG